MPGPGEKSGGTVEVLIVTGIGGAAVEGAARLPFAGQKIPPQSDLGAGRGAGESELPTERAELGGNPRRIRHPDPKIPPADLVGIRIVGRRRDLVVQRRAEERHIVRHGRKRHPAGQRARRRRAAIVKGDVVGAVGEHRRHERDTVAHGATDLGKRIVEPLARRVVPADGNVDIGREAGERRLPTNLIDGHLDAVEHIPSRR